MCYFETEGKCLENRIIIQKNVYAYLLTTAACPFLFGPAMYALCIVVEYYLCDSYVILQYVTEKIFVLLKYNRVSKEI